MKASKCCKADVKKEHVIGYPGKGFKTAVYYRCSTCNYIIDIVDQTKDIHNAHYSSKFNRHENH